MISHKWQPIEEIDDASNEYDFSEIANLQRQWLDIKNQAENSNPAAYTEFMKQLERRWAIETGIIEGIYDLDRGVTKTLVEKGIIADYIERASTNKEPQELVEILRDHQGCFESIHEHIREGWPLTKWFIKAIHSQILKRQDTHTAIDQFGLKFEAKIDKGKFKRLPNNPTRPDGTLHEYCPPEQVESELDNLLGKYEMYEEEGCSPLLTAAWLHHRFAQIHPFQDGNGRVGRAIVTWHLVKKGFLPIVVSRDDRDDYIDALERGDGGELTPLIDLFVRLEKTTILLALSASEPETEAAVGERRLVSQVLDSIVEREQRKRQTRIEELRSVNGIAVELQTMAAEYLETTSHEAKERLMEAGIYVDPRLVVGGPDHQNEHWYRLQVIDTANESQHWVNLNEARYFVRMTLDPTGGVRTPRLIFVVSLHSIGRGLTGVMAATAFAEIEYYAKDDTLGPSEQSDSTFFRNCAVNPFTLTWEDSAEAVSPRFIQWVEGCLSIALSHWGTFLAGSTH